MLRPGNDIVRATRWLLVACLVWGAGGVARAIPQRVESAVEDRISELRAEIARHDELYFKQAKAEISDADYDRLKRELQALEDTHPELARADASVGDDRTGRFPTKPHRVRMLSLGKIYTEQEWRAFYARLARQLGRPDLAFVIEPKFDGLAISLTYEHGVLVRAVTRGNGLEGDDVTANVRTIGALPTELRGDRATMPALIELRGEIYLDTAEFDRINAERETTGDEPFAHPRNLAAGTLKSADPAETAQRRLSVVVYGWGAWEGTPTPATQTAFHAQVRAWGVPGVARWQTARTADEGWAAIRALGRERGNLGFPIDGAVAKLDEVALQTRLGADDTVPHWAIAYKFEPERVTTRLRAINIQVGRTGALTPVAEFDPVELGGATVTRATLHNRDEIARRDLRIGDLIEVEKAGEIIPAIVGVQLSSRPAGTTAYVFPARCPSCGTEVAAKPGEATVFCLNPRCPAQRQRRLEHFVSADAVDIGGFGPATIAALVKAGLLQSPADFYRLRREDLVRVDGIGEKTADRLLAGVERSKRAELWRFINGLSLPRVGKVNARQLALRCGDLVSLLRMSEKSLAEIVGPAAAASVADFMARPENQADIRELSAAVMSSANPTAPR